MSVVPPKRAAIDDPGPRLVRSLRRQDAPIGRSRRRKATASRRRRILLALAVVLTPVAYSYFSALTGPGADSVSARSVEWMRNNHLGGVVDAVERRWYDHHQAKVGGTPAATKATPRLADAAPP